MENSGIYQYKFYKFDVQMKYHVYLLQGNYIDKTSTIPIFNLPFSICRCLCSFQAFQNILLT